MPVLLLLATVLAVTRLSRLITVDYVTHRFRQWVADRWGPDSMVAYLVSCPWCMSMWVAPPVAAAVVWWPTNRAVHVALIALAASYVAGFLVTEMETD